ncbi:Crp/Fnr family transcriptional regulator [Ktedonosporobacter rubrisoli]|uniref:Crp/Fnr family transcriptional regulator n=1 Tax=Ktedonosporobacter rubrisoli TaxID=2509675 RepID=A0A4P6JSB2_KTERU|nr:Crp/Fnr family transcriptional regulator [Ktedonosporobacter rubrisoli]QBD78418.1 Crp/Fnr family transcriptional regulator [Ktedonosporobacter rubrisoli]
MSFLAHTDIFSHLGSEEIHELDRITTVITCSPGRIFFRPGETGTLFFLLKSGHVQLYHLSLDGRKLITATLGSGECFGELPLLSGGTHSSFAEAIEEACIYTMSKQDLEPLLIHKPSVTLALTQILGQRIMQLEEQLINTAFKSTSARLALLLLQLAHTPEPASGMLVVDGLSHEELAEHLGVYRETVSTALRELRESGAIELGRKHITINRPDQLETMASFPGNSNKA